VTLRRLVALAPVPLLAACGTPTPTYAPATLPPVVSYVPARTAGVPPCLGGDLRITLTARDRFRTGAPVRALIKAVNVSDRTCRVTGWLTLGLVDAAERVEPVRVEPVERPGPAERVDVEPGRFAPAGLKWIPCASGTAGCRSGIGLRVAAPGGVPQQATLENFPPAVVMSAVQIGPFRTDPIGVLAW